jgi:GH35 family endo-1,4-beta-xylanase
MRFLTVLAACLSLGSSCDSFMVWGFTDHIWFPTQWLAGEMPAIFDGDYHPKPAFFALQKLLAEDSSE